MSNDFPSSASGSSDVSSPQQFGRGNRNRPDRGKQKKKNPSEGDYESGGDDDEQGSYENRKQKSSVSLGIQNKVISKKQEIKPRKLPPAQTAPSVAIFLYKPGMELPSLRQYLNQIIEIRIASEYIHKSNPALMMRQIWGSNGVYASHSDAVCIGIHNGQLGLNDIKNTSLMYQGVALLCKVIKGKKTLNQALKPPLLSRPMKTPCAHCLKPEKAVWLQSSGSNPNHSFGTPEQLIQWASKMSLPPSRRMTKKNHLQVYCHEQPQLVQPENLLMKNMPPFNQGWIIWDMCNEPAQKYNLITFMDKQSVNAYENNTSYKLRTHVLYIENNKDKYEITMDPKFMDEDVFLNANAYIVYQVLNPSVVDLEFINNNGSPLPAVNKQLLYKSLPWSSFEWGNDDVLVNGTRIDIKCFRFVPIQYKIYMFPCNQSNIHTPFGIIIDPYINTQPYFNQQAPTVSAHQPPNFDVDWFFFDIDMKWKQFDWRRCNLLENMLHYCNQGEYQIVYRDILYIIDYDHMVMHHEDQYIKLRRETSIISKQVRLGTGKWSFYNGQTWVQYEKPIQQQLEDLMVRQEPVIMMICNGVKYVFDLEQNCEIQSLDEKGINKRKIITRQYMNTQQLQEFGRTRKTQEQNYMRERRILEDYMKSANHQKRKNKHYKKAPEQQQEESTSKLFKMIQLPQSPQIDPKKLEEWNLLIEQMKSEI